MKLLKYIENPIVRGSMVMIIGTNAGSFLNYIYHFVMGRVLTPSYYGELVVLFSVLSMLAIVPTTFGLVIIRFIAISETKLEIEKLIWYFRVGIFAVGMIVLVAGLGFSKNVGDYLKIDQPYLLLLVSGCFIVSTQSFVNKSVLQGLVKFNEFVIVNIFENFAKLVFGVVFVILGWYVGGAMLGLFIAGLLGWLISWWFIHDFRFIINFDFKSSRKLLSFSLPVFIQSIATTSLFSSDILLVKHYFSAIDAGVYAACSSLAKITLFASGPINSVMFPWVAKRKSLNGDFYIIFFWSVILTVLICTGVLLIYYLFPNLAINILFGGAYVSGTPILFIMGVFMTLLTISLLMINFFLSINKTWVVIFPLVSAIMQVAGISNWHTSLWEVVIVNNIVCLFMLVCLIMFTAKSYKSTKKWKLFHHQ